MSMKDSKTISDPGSIPGRSTKGIGFLTRKSPADYAGVFRGPVKVSTGLDGESGDIREALT